MRRFFRNQKGELSLAAGFLFASVTAVAVGFGILSNHFSKMDMAAVESNRGKIEQRAVDMKKTAALYDRKAGKVGSSDPGKAALYQQKAKELRTAAGITKRLANEYVAHEKKRFTSPIKFTLPVHYELKTLAEMNWSSSRSRYDEEARTKLKELGRSDRERSALFSDIVRARLDAIYRSLGGRFMNGIPIDSELRAMAVNRLQKLYKNDALVRRREYKKALEKIAGVNVKGGGAGPWIVWYAGNIAYNPLYISTKKRFQAEERSMDYDGGGMNPTVKLDKVFALGPYPTREAAIKGLKGSLSKYDRLGGIYSHIRTAKLGGKRHNINHVDIGEQ